MVLFDFVHDGLFGNSLFECRHVMGAAVLEFALVSSSTNFIAYHFCSFLFYFMKFFFEFGLICPTESVFEWLRIVVNANVET